jgi:hypothetical protein
MRLKLISCEVFFREMCATVARSPNQVDVEFLPKGLHDIGQVGMSARMQQAVDKVDETQYDAIILGYGLCNNGLAGLTARGIPLVMTRAHDCITMFLGSKERYLDYFNNHPGVYFKTSGWIERGEATGELSQMSIQRMAGLDKSYDELVEKYGEDNAQYLYDQLYGYKNYGQITFIEMGIEMDDRFEKSAMQTAQEKGWQFQKERGNMRLIEKLVNGDWNEEEFLVVQPGHRIVVDYSDPVRIIKTEQTT